MTNKEYLQNAADSNRNKWLSADAWAADAWAADAWAADAWAADEIGGNEQKRPPAVFIIQIVNSKSGIGPPAAVSNVDIGDSYTNRAAANFNQSADITITSTISGVTYREFLAQSESQPFTVGKTMIISTSSGQLDQSVAITHRNSSGDRQDHVITPTLDPYQTQTDRIIDDYEYIFDGMTRLRFNQINATATVTVRMYLINKFSSSQIISGRQEIQKYSASNIIR